MIQLTYIGEKSLYDIIFKRINKHVIQLKGDFPIKEKGFLLSRYGHNDNWDYSNYTTVYRKTEGGTQFSNNGSVYTEPEKSTTSVPAKPESYVPTLDDIKAEKIDEMSFIQQNAIREGIYVPLSDGSVEHFTLTADDQMNLIRLQAQAAAGEEKIPWYTSDPSKHCRYYSNADMSLIADTAMRHISFHDTYYRDLRIYINSLTDEASAAAMEYGTLIPEKYQSEVLKDMYAIMAKSK